MSNESGGHYYKRSGEPCYEVPAKSKGPGGMRAVWISDAISLSLVPSVTTVTGVVAKDALFDYFVKEGAKHALENPMQPGEDMDAYLKRICAGSKLHAKAAAIEGSKIHDAIEGSFKLRHYPDEYHEHVIATLEEIQRLFPDVKDWVSEKSFAHPMGFGGKVDLHSPSTGIVVDFKTKPGALDDGKKLAFDQNVQLAAYQVGLGLCVYEPVEVYTSRVVQLQECANIFVSRTHPGKVASHVWSADDISAGWRVFSAALTLWRELKQYDPRF